MHDFIKTFHSRDFYARLLRDGQGLGMKFIGWTVLIEIVFTLIMVVPALPEVSTVMDTIANELPAVTITKGKLSIDKPSPYFVGGETGKERVLFDMREQSSEVDALSKRLEKEELAVLVTPDFVAIKKTNSVEINSFSNFVDHDLSVSHEKWLEYCKLLKRIGLGVLVAFLLIGIFLITFFINAIKSVVVLIMSLFFKTKPEFTDAFRLSAAAGVPAVLIGDVYDVLANYSGLPSLPYLEFLLWAAFALFGLLSANALPPQTKRNEQSVW